MKKALVTGCSGFIGSHLVDELLRDGWWVTGIDNFDDSYSPQAKWDNISAHLCNPNYELIQGDILNLKSLHDGLDRDYQVIVHLAARVGVRPSIDDPVPYQDTNVGGTQNVLELARKLKTPQFIFASSSSVYGINPKTPWREDDSVLRPISPYAGSKVSGELLGHVYSHLFGIRFVALRFFTVFGPRQRPDLAIHKFTSLIRSGRPVPVYGDGSSCRDYTYVADIVDGLKAAIKYEETPYEVFNLGNGSPVGLLELIRCIAETLGMTPALCFLPPAAGDVRQTYACIEKARRLLAYNPDTPLSDGVRAFVEWFKLGELRLTR